VSQTSQQLANRIFDSLSAVAKYLEPALLDPSSVASITRLEPFTTNRLIAHPLRAEDLPELCLMHGDIEVMKYMGGVRNEEETKRWLLDNLDHWRLHGFGLWVFRHGVDAKFVGRCGLRRVQLNSDDEVELGYALVTRYWGAGLATEMANAILGIGFEQLGLRNVIALVDAANTASRSLAERLGFKFERTVEWKSLPTMLFRLERGQRTNTPRFVSNSP
jgi:[ribosomal protein S5]-alanine N-acetyltransferase